MKSDITKPHNTRNFKRKWTYTIIEQDRKTLTKTLTLKK